MIDDARTTHICRVPRKAGGGGGMGQAGGTPGNRRYRYGTVRTVQYTITVDMAFYCTEQYIISSYNINTVLYCMDCTVGLYCMYRGINVGL